MPIDDVVHQRVRLAGLALLSHGPRSFTELREELAQSDGGLGRHLKVLADAGYVELTKSFQDNRPRTDVTLTEAGRAALETERGALAELINALPDPFAFPLGTRRIRAGTRAADHILGETFAPFYLDKQWPLGPDFALPDGLPAWPSHPAQQATFLSQGLLGGHLRRWTTVTKQEWIHLMLLEFAEADAPERIMSALAESTVYVPGVLPVRAYQRSSSCVIWLRRGPFLCCINVSGPEDVVQNRAITLVRDQYRALPASDRDPVEATPAQVCG
ncbi:MAG TPA: transcriptional regulator [Pseudonocardiaceae bacterium]